MGVIPNGNWIWIDFNEFLWSNIAIPFNSLMTPIIEWPHYVMNVNGIVIFEWGPINNPSLPKGVCKSGLIFSIWRSFSCPKSASATWQHCEARVFDQITSNQASCGLNYEYYHHLHSEPNRLTIKPVKSMLDCFTTSKDMKYHTMRRKVK